MEKDGMKNWQRIFSVFIVFIVMTSYCGDEDARTRIIIKGSDLLKIVMERLVKEYHREHPEVEIHLIGGGTDRGIGAILDRGDCDIAMILRPLSNDEISIVNQLDITYELKNFVHHRIKFIINTKNKLEYINKEILQRIYLGQLRLWSNVSEEIKLNVVDNEISVLSPESNTGNYFIVHNQILNNRNFYDQMLELPSDIEIKQYVSDHVSSIGYISEYHLDDTVKWLPIYEFNPELVQNISEMMPNPLQRLSYLMMRKPINEETQSFLDFIYSPQGIEIIRNEGFFIRSTSRSRFNSSEAEEETEAPTEDSIENQNETIPIIETNE